MNLYHPHDHIHPHEPDNGPEALLFRQMSRRRLMVLLSGAALGFVACDNQKEASNTPAVATTSIPSGPSVVPTVTNPVTTSLATGGSFGAFPKVSTRAEGQLLLVESDGMPDHEMMVGIRSWQQQVPLPQPYTGTNAWRVPLKGILADNPVSAKTALFRGAIALAANGVPIFNALNNRGDDSYLAGELDQWGGHSGRADDYHYHIAPVHLQSTLGTTVPLAYGLDGFPLYGLTEPDGTNVTGLDEFNGHTDAAGNYHYHATLTYPYINGGMRGVVQVRDDQVDPQPAAVPVRPALTPLNGATITGFKTNSPGAYSLEYQVAGKTYTLNYGFQGNSYTFEFIDPTNTTRTETYTRS